MNAAGDAARPPRAFLACVALAGCLLRLAFGLGYWIHQPLTRDEAEYLSLARSLASGHGFVYDPALLEGAVEPYGRAPGYPAWLALTGGGRSVVDEVPAGVKIAQAIAGALGVWLTGLLAYRLAGPRAARIAAVVAACEPPLVWIAAYALSEALVWPIALLAAWMFDRAVGSRGRTAGSLGVAAGVFFGATILVRAATSLALALAALWLLWRRRPGLLAAVVLGAALVVAPWSIRMTRHDGRFVLVATDGGVTFWTGNNARATGEGDQAANPDLKRASQALRAEHPALTEEAMEPVYYHEALRWMADHPWAWVRLEMKKAFYLVVPIGPSYRLHSARYYWGSVLPYGLLLPFALVGAWRVRGRLGETPGLWLFAAGTIAVCLVFFPQERFRIPLIDTALVVLASACVRPTTDAVA